MSTPSTPTDQHIEAVDFDKVRVIIGETDRRFMQGITSTLQSNGFREIVAVAEYEKFEEQNASGKADLILCADTISDTDVCPLIQKTRRNETGDNPFVSIIVFSNSADQITVDRIIESGADDLIVKPFSSGELMKRIERLISRRRPFIVTHDYVGPDSKKTKLTGRIKAPLMEVPNSLAIKVKNPPAEGHLRDTVKLGIDALKKQIIECKAAHLILQIDDSLPMYPSVKLSQSLEEDYRNIIDNAGDILRRINGTPFAQEDVLFNTLIDILRKVIILSVTPSRSDMETLKKLTFLIARAFRSLSACELPPESPKEAAFIEEHEKAGSVTSTPMD